MCHAFPVARHIIPQRTRKHTKEAKSHKKKPRDIQRDCLDRGYRTKKASRQFAFFLSGMIIERLRETKRLTVFFSVSSTIPEQNDETIPPILIPFYTFLIIPTV